MPAEGNPAADEGVPPAPHPLQQDHTAEERRRAQAQCASIIAISADAIVSVDEAQRITLFNHGAEAVFGYRADEVLGRPLDILIPEAVREVHREHVREFGASGIDVRRMGERGEVVGLRKSGDLFPADATISKTEVEGEVVYTAILRDITARVHIEHALREANEGLHALLQAAPLAIVAVDPLGVVTIWNPAAERILGWDEAEMLGQPAPFLGDQVWGECLRHVERARQGEVLTSLHASCLRKDGSRLAMRASFAPLRDEGEIRGVVVLLEDASERERAEEAERRLMTIIEASPDLAGVVDTQGRFLYLNPAGRRLLGLEGVDLTTRTITEFYPAQMLPLVLQVAIPTAIREGTWSGEAALLSADGREIPVTKVVIAHRGPSGEVDYLSTVMHDISQRKRAEETREFIVEAGRTLSDSIEYDEVLSNITRVIVPWLADYCVIDLLEPDGQVSRPIVHHRDPPRQELLDKLRRFPAVVGQPVGPGRVLKTGEPELVSEVSSAWLQTSAQNEEHLQLLLQLAPRSELSVPLLMRGQVIGAATGTFTDVSGRNYNEELQALALSLAGRAALAIDNARLYRGLQQAVHTRDEVLRIVAHDLRNPLNTISLSAGLLEESMPPEMSAHCGPQLDIIRRAIERADRLIEDLLDVARVQGGNLSIEPHPADPLPILEEALALQRIPAEEHELQLEGRFPPDIPAVLADRDRILQVLGNLLSNAIKFTPEGGRIMVGAVALEGEVRFSVADTGEGIAEDQLVHLFDPFWQARPKSGEGTGLGLTICRGIIAAHGGRIWAESTVGKGTTFFFTLPVATSAPERPLVAPT